MRKHISTIIAGIIFLTGLSLLLYPTISNYWNSRHQTQAVAEYSDRMEKMDEKEKEQLIEEAEAYNQTLIADAGTFYSVGRIGCAVSEHFKYRWNRNYGIYYNSGDSL